MQHSAVTDLTNTDDPNLQDKRNQVLFEFLALIYKGWNWGNFPCLTRILSIQHHPHHTPPLNEKRFVRSSGIDSGPANLFYNIIQRLLCYEALGEGRDNIP